MTITRQPAVLAAITSMTTISGAPARPDLRQVSAGERRAARAQGLRTLRDLVIDVGVPLGSYYLLRDGLGVSLWLSLAVSSVGPAIRSVYSLAVKRELNVLAMLMLIVNIAGIAVSFVTGDPRTLIAKDAAVSSVIGLTMLGSVALRRPVMSAGLRLFLTKGTAAREAAYEGLVARSAAFRRHDLIYTVIWGVALLAECTARIAGAYTLPVTTMAWLGSVLTIAAIGLATLVGGVGAAGPMLFQVEAEVRAGKQA